MGWRTIGKPIKGGTKKVSKKKRQRQKLKWIKQFSAELDEIKERLKLVEEKIGEILDERPEH